MAQTGYTPILIYSSSTVSQAPAAGNLTNSTLGSELAINITDGKLFYKDNGNAVQVIAWKVTPTTAGGTGLTSYTAGDLLYYATGTTLTKLAIGASTTILTSSGSAPQWSAASGITVGTATNLAGGLAGSVPYQSGAGATTFLGIGSANTVLTSSGSAPQWSTSLTMAGSVTATALIPSSSSIPTNGMYLPSSNTVGWATNSSFRMSVGSGGLSINTTTSNAQLTVASTNSGTGVPTAGNSTLWLINDGGSVIANNGPAITFNARSRGTPNEIQVMAGLKGAKLNANDDEIAGYLAFYTSDNSTRTLVERARIDNLGNYIPATAGRGINFTANTPAAGMTSQLLNWYEEGTCSFTVTSTSGTITTASASAVYTRVGRNVLITGTVTVTTNGTGAGALTVAGLPFTPGTAACGVGRESVNNGKTCSFMVSASSTSMSVQAYDNTYPVASGSVIQFSVSYSV